MTDKINGSSDLLKEVNVVGSLLEFNEYNHQVEMQNSVAQEKIPEDKRWLIYWSLYLFGFGALTPWSAFVSSIDYFKDVYPDRKVIRCIALVYFIPAATLLAILVWKPSLCKGLSHVQHGFFAFTVLLAAVPTFSIIFIGHGEGTALTFTLLMCLVLVIGIFVTLVEGSTIAATLFLPKEYPGAYIGGAGCAGLFISILRVLTKAVFTDSKNGLRISAFVFFYISTFICLCGFLVCRYYVIHHPFVIYHKTKNLREITENARLLEQDSREKLNVRVIRRLREPIIILLIIYTVSIAVYPGVAEDVESDTLGSWYSVILVVVFCFFDFLSRSLPLSMITSNVFWVTCGSMSRILLVPICILAVHYFSNPFIIGTLLMIIGASNGYLTQAAFHIGHQRTEGYQESLIGGNVLLLALFVGLNFGAFVSLLLAKI